MSQNKLLKSVTAALASPRLFFMVGWGLLALIIIFMGVSQTGSSFDQDELEAIHTSWKLIHDGVIYRDFFQHHHPLLYYLLKPIILFFGENFRTLIIIKMITFCIYLLIAAVAYLLGVHIVGSLAALISLYLLIPAPIFTKLLQTRPDGLQVLFSMLALLFLFYFFDEKKAGKKKIWLVLSALSLSISFLALQKALFLMVAIGVLLTGAAFYGRITWREWLWYPVIWSVPVAAYLGYLYFTGSLSIYYKLNWLFNIGLPTRFLPFYTFLILGQSQILLLFYTLGLWGYLKSFNQRVIGGLSVWLLFAAIFLVRCSYAQYYAPAIPLMALIAAHTLAVMVDYDRSKLLIIIGVLAFHPVCSWGYVAAKTLFKPVQNEQHERIKYVLNTVPPGVPVYDGENNFNIFRPDIDYLWFVACDERVVKNITSFHQALTGRYFDKYAALRARRPLIISASFLDMQHEYIKDNYRTSDRFDDLYMLNEPS